MNIYEIIIRKRGGMSLNILTELNTISKKNGKIYWSLTDIAKFFDYQSELTFKKIVEKAMAFSLSLGIDTFDEFEVIKDSRGSTSYKISLYGVLLCSMFADLSKPNVKEVRVGLAEYAKFLSQDIERVEERQNLRHGEKYMSSVAFDSGLENAKFGLFKDSGYRGMYNMSLNKIKEYKNLGKSSSIYDYMDITELAANTFRVTQTAEKIKNQKLYGSEALIKAAKDIGKEVRDIVKKNTGMLPEDLPIVPKIRSVETKIKKGRVINEIVHEKEDSQK